MTTNLGEKLREAQESKNNDVYSYIWKNARNDKNEQEEIRLMDATEEQLNKFYKHCESMLYNTNSINPGRYVLLGIIDEQRTNCNIELFLRWLENTYDTSDRTSIHRSQFLRMISTFKKSNPELAQNKDLLITTMASGIPLEFENLTINSVIDGCLGRLGSFDKKHMTLKFITNKLGLWFTPQEMNEFTEAAKQTGKTRLDIVKERCGLLPTVSISAYDNKVLNYKEFRALILLKTKQYSLLTNDQLLVLRDKGLFVLEEEVRKHIKQWETLISQINKVAEIKNYNINK